MRQENNGGILSEGAVGVCFFPLEENYNKARKDVVQNNYIVTTSVVPQQYTDRFPSVKQLSGFRY
jgi:hypothetical protein